MDAVTRRQFARLLAGTGAAAAFTQLGLSAAIGAPVAGYKAMVGIFLFGGNDGWNMIVPTDARNAAYQAARGSGLALPASALSPLRGTAYGLHPAMAALQPIWNDGAMGVVLNTGTLYQPLTKTLYQQRADLRPLNLMSHSDEQAHWQGLRARDINADGFLGRLNDRVAQASIPSLIGFGGSNLAILGRTNAPLILPSTGTVARSGASDNRGDPLVAARMDAVTAFADASAAGTVADTTARGMSSAYDQIVTANAVLSGTTSIVDGYFKNPTTGAALTSDVSRQLLRVARMIEARGALGHARQTFFVSQGGYDTHANQVAGDNSTGTHATLLGDLAMAIAGFYGAIKALGLSENVTAFTMSDFGRVFKANAQRGTDHAWGSNHIVVGGALRPGIVYGDYPQPVLGGADDINSDGRFLPTIAQEEYLGAIAMWHGVADADMPYVFPNWSTWSGGGRGPLALFKAT